MTMTAMTDLTPPVTTLDVNQGVPTTTEARGSRPAASCELLAFAIQLEADGTGVDDLVPLLAQLARDEGSNELTTEQALQMLQAALEQSYEIVRVTQNTALIGFCMYRCNAQGFVHLRYLFIRHESRRQGLARSTLDWLADHRWKRPCCVALEVFYTNENGLAFWASVGFARFTITMTRMLEAAAEPLASP